MSADDAPEQRGPNCSDHRRVIIAATSPFGCLLAGSCLRFVRPITLGRTALDRQRRVADDRLPKAALGNGPDAGS
jgi:hypothetical protein